LLVLAAGVLLLVLYDLTTELIGDGLITYRVRLTSRVPVREAVAKVYSRPEQAESVAQQFLSLAEFRSSASPTDSAGEPLEVRVWVTTRVSGLGLRRTRVQQTGLLVIADLADGRHVAKAVELPDARESREVTVALD
jgi:hypothetical protein